MEDTFNGRLWEINGGVYPNMSFSTLSLATLFVHLIHTEHSHALRVILRVVLATCLCTGKIE